MLLSLCSSFSRNRAPFSTFSGNQDQEIKKEKTEREKKCTLGRIDLRDDNRVDKSHIFLLRGQ